MKARLSSVALLGTPYTAFTDLIRAAQGAKKPPCLFSVIPAGESPCSENERDAYLAVFVFSGRRDKSVPAETVHGWIGAPHLRVIGGGNGEEEREEFLSEFYALFEHLETERKFLIRYPDLKSLRTSPYASFSRITQTYLVSEPSVTERVRCRTSGESTVYTHTVKVRRSGDSSEEYEEEISKDVYEAYLARADRSKKPIEKERGVILYEGKYFELDLYPFWSDRAIVELEFLPSERAEIILPPFFSLIRDVTEDLRYKNTRLAKEVPYDPIG